VDSLSAMNTKSNKRFKITGLGFPEAVHGRLDILHAPSTGFIFQLYSIVNSKNIRMIIRTGQNNIKSPSFIDPDDLNCTKISEVYIMSSIYNLASNFKNT
jgi:hypothetical protein